MTYLKIDYSTSTAQDKESIIALLAEHPFTGFEETDSGISAYIAKEDYVDEVKAVEQFIVNAFNLQPAYTEIEEKNWNADWEKDYKAVVVDNFCYVRAEFHEEMPTVKHEIKITPKMSFGTGHHATTYMMMKQMQDIDFSEKSVFDYGCGTGVLIILAHLLGGKELDAVDIDKWAYENALENYELNQCTNEINMYLGEIDVVPLRKYNIILANINRNVLLNSFADMHKRLEDNGTLVCSGFLEQDEQLLIDKAASFGLSIKRRLHRGKWLCIAFQ